MATRFMNVDRDTPMLLPPDLREWGPDEDMVHFIIEAVFGIIKQVMGYRQTLLRGEQQASPAAKYIPRQLPDTATSATKHIPHQSPNTHHANRDPS